MKDIKLTYTGKVENGKIQLPGKRLRQEVCSAYEGKRIEVTFQPARKRRSNEQNAYYWGVVIPVIISALIDLGNELQQGNAEHANQVHEFLKDRFLENGGEVFGKEGDIIQLPGSTKKCTTSEMMDYFARIQKWANEFLGIVIPEPNEQLSIF